MIKSLASSRHEDRVRASECDIRVVVVVHEAGHIVMSKLHGRDVQILLPEIATQDGIMRIAEHAAGIINAKGLDREGIADICFGGYCGELTFYDEKIVRSGSLRRLVKADRAANDLIVFVRRNGKNPKAALALEHRLKAGGEQASETVHELFEHYGKETYSKMLQRRDELIDTAQNLFEFWSARQFKKCELL